MTKDKKKSRHVRIIYPASFFESWLVQESVSWEIYTCKAVLDFEEPKILFFVDYLAMMGVFIYMAHFLRILFIQMSRRKSKYEVYNIR